MPEVTTYRWWSGVAREVYFDDSRPQDYVVPHYAVRYDVRPPGYRRVVLERDSRFHEPVSVAYEPTDSARRRMFVSNKRFGFKLSQVSEGVQVLYPTTNSVKLLRNAVMWCAGADRTKLTTLVPTSPQPLDTYSPGGQPPILFTGMDLPQVCGNTDYITTLLDALPPEGLYVEAKYLPVYAPGGLYFDNGDAQVYRRSVEGSEHLRVEFGEYTRPSLPGDRRAYTTPGYTGVETGIRDGGLVYRFWDGLWTQSLATQVFLDTLLDARVGGSGVPRADDLIDVVNPARLILSHFLSRGAAVVVVRVTPIDDDESPADALARQRASVDSLPWEQINKTLPTSANCVILYAVDQQ